MRKVEGGMEKVEGNDRIRFNQSELCACVEFSSNINEVLLEGLTLAPSQCRDPKIKWFPTALKDSKHFVV